MWNTVECERDSFSGALGGARETFALSRTPYYSTCVLPRLKARWNTFGMSLLLRRERHWGYLSCTLLHWEGVSHCLRAKWNTFGMPPLLRRERDWSWGRMGGCFFLPKLKLHWVAHSKIEFFFVHPSVHTSDDLEFSYYLCWWPLVYLFISFFASLHGLFRVFTQALPISRYHSLPECNMSESLAGCSIFRVNAKIYIYFLNFYYWRKYILNLNFALWDSIVNRAKDVFTYSFSEYT